MFRSPFSIALFALCFAALACASPSAHAVQTYCVGTVAELRTALDQAEIDGDDSRVDLRTGTYNFTSQLRYDTDLESFVPPGSLTIEGGYSAGCASRVDDASLTVLHSDSGQPFLMQTTTSTVVLKTLTIDQTEVFFNGHIPSNSCSSSNLKFESRRLHMIGGTLNASSPCHDIVFRDSLFTNAADGVALFVYMRGNDDDVTTTLTMVNNTVAEGRLQLLSCCDYQSAAFLYNNVFRNAGTEISAEATNVLALNNRYDSLVFSAGSSGLSAGILIPGSANNVATNPNLGVDYRPNVSSAMIDSGTSTVPGGLLSIDLYGGPRVIGSEVDRGALESPVDGTGIFTVTNTNASGAGSLSAAIDLANADTGFNRIHFNIAGTCPRRIVLPSTLYLRDPVRLDGWTQPGNLKNTDSLYWDGKPCVILDGNGTLLTGIDTGSQLGNGIVTIRGLAFEGFTGAAILLTFGNGSYIHGNQFGGRIGDTGTVLAGNGTAINVGLSAVNNLIGGSENAQANLIGGSSATGVAVQAGSTGNQIVGNRIGMDKNYITALPNLDGIRISTANNSVRDNFISRNTRDGVVLTGANANGNVVRDNTVGGNVGFLALPGNGRMGVLIDNDAHDNAIGPGNRMNLNGDSAVRLLAGSGGHNRITQNAINANDSPGIDLGANGVNPNDFDPALCDMTIGCPANRGQNFPNLTQALRVRSGLFPLGRPIRVRGSLTTTVSSTPYRIEFFGSDTCYSEGNGQGTRYLGSADIVVANAGFCGPNNNCSKTIDTYVTELNVDIGDVITATATSPRGDTSEFSECMVVTDEITDRIFANGFD